MFVLVWVDGLWNEVCSVLAEGCEAGGTAESGIESV